MTQIHTTATWRIGKRTSVTVMVSSTPDRADEAIARALSDMGFNSDVDDLAEVLAAALVGTARSVRSRSLVVAMARARDVEIRLTTGRTPYHLEAHWRLPRSGEATVSVGPATFVEILDEAVETLTTFFLPIPGQRMGRGEADAGKGATRPGEFRDEGPVDRWIAHATTLAGDA